ncbi:peroxiredoxin-like family protein [Microtetraspora sp. NBRC 16547]|uniref:peroxiredoxin-like family protein n=1 Tax=Microtetraspora sp. NBRC 16547 TaxID=3030993 RepID=UPI0024A4A0A8|nr:peroxiredoxin-like family protein [Microtetraspora sp. NBRC 16547]GLW99327.1 alkyl hydroperoxide reductase [Microtetraspora sp. NBRC 16547]
MTASLKEQFAATARTATRPQHVIDAINAAFNGIAEAGLVPGLEVGDVAPPFTLPDGTGQDVSLDSRVADGPVVLTFYRGAWCPYCNLELRAYQQILPELSARGARLIAVSPERPDDSLSIKQKHGLEFDVLSDLAQEVIAAYRIRFELPESVKPHLLDGTVVALAKQQPDGRWSLPVPATYVLDRERVVRARHVSMNYRTRMEPADALRAVEQIISAEEEHHSDQ